MRDALRADAPASATARDGAADRAPAPALVIAVPALITLHNVEELLALPRFLPRMAAWLPELDVGISVPQLDVAVRLPAELTPRAYLLALTVVTVLAWAIALAALAGRRSGIHLLLVAQATMLLNVVPHLVLAGVTGGYAPGLATAICINLPFGVWLLRRARREGWIGRGAWAMLLPLALLVHGPLLMGLVWLCARITGAG